MLKKKVIGIIAFYALVLILATTFFFTDLEISKFMVNDNPNGFYVLMEAIGEFPIYLGPILFGLVYGFTSEIKLRKMLFHFVGLIATYIAFIRLSGGIFECYFNSQLGASQYGLLAVASLLAYLLLFILFNRVKIEDMQKIRDITIMILLVSIASFCMVTIFKYIWGRPRFRILSSDYAEYVNFLTIDGFKNGLPSDDFRSFPSGHTNAATSLIMFGLLPARFTSKKWIIIIRNIKYLFS